MQSFRLSQMLNFGYFEIPRYQRAYSWGNKQQEQFIEDLRHANSRYYLGHFLLEESNDDSFNVIDGQQRLTTIVIFASCLCAELSKRDEKQYANLIGKIRSTYLTVDYTNKRRLKTVDFDDTFFMNEIVDRRCFVPKGELTTVSQLHIRQCREFFDKVFAKEKIDELLRWEDLVSNATVTYYIVENKIDAVQIFAFSNDRGKQLSKLEVLKSFFMLQIYINAESPSDNIQRLYDSFADIYRVIMKISTDEDNVLRYFWMGYGDKGYYTDDYLSEIKTHCKERGIDEVICFTEQLARAFHYVEIIEHDNSFDMSNMRRLDRMAQVWPILIKAKCLCNVSEKGWIRLVRILENVISRSAIRGGRADIESRLHGFLRNFDNEDELNKAIDSFKEKMKYDYWNDEEFKGALKNKNIYLRNRKACSYFLWRYEQFLCPPGYPKTKVTWDDIVKKESLEHIAPQHPDNNQLANGYGEYINNENPEEGIESGQWLHSIGNLLLMSQSQNSSIGNKDFVDVKLKSYEDDNLMWQQKEIRSFLDNKNILWTKDSIKKRGELLVKAAMEIWDLDKI